MGILHWLLGKKDASQFQATNRLEALLHEAARKPEKRPEFYRQIFHFELLAIGKVENKPNGEQVISLLTGGTETDPVIYAYTSEAALSWSLAKAKQGSKPYVQMKTEDLFRIIHGRQGIILNSGHDHGLHLSPSEVSNVLQPPQSVEKLARSETVNLGKPAELPDAFLNTLSAYKTGNPAIQHLRFGMIQRPGGDPEYLYVLDFKEGCSQSAKDLVKVDLYRLTKDAYRRDVPVNFLDLAELPDQGIWTEEGLLHSL